MIFTNFHIKLAYPRTIWNFLNTCCWNIFFGDIILITIYFIFWYYISNLLSKHYYRSIWNWYRAESIKESKNRRFIFFSFWYGSWCFYYFCRVFKTLNWRNPNFPSSLSALDDFQPKICAFVLFESFALMGTSNLLLFFSLVSLCAMAASKVVLIGNNITLSFDDIEANFGEFSVLCV